MEDFKDTVFKSLKKIEKWVEDHHYKGYEPFDGLSSRFRPLTFGNLFLERLLLQLIRQCPLNLRPLFGVKPLESTIGRGYMAWGYCQMYKLTGDPEYKSKIDNCLGWLIRNDSSGCEGEGFAWGKHFDFASRGGLYAAFEPILVWTVLIGYAFIEAYEIFNEKRYLEVSKGICSWIMNLPRHETESGFCLGYHMNDKYGTVHNSNMVGAAFLARVAKHTKNSDYLVTARGAMEFSCNRQLSNGAWLYGENPKNHWIDNFHTGYNLDGLKCYIESSGDREFENKLKKGIEFYKNNFFEYNGRPKYYHNRAYPIDSQCAAQAIDTLAKFSQFDDEALSLTKKIILWTIHNMQDSKGYFYYRIYPGGIRAKTPMLHWAQATLYKALALYLNIDSK